MLKYPNLMLFGVMFVTGVIGGTFNTLRDRKDDAVKAKLWSHLLGGLVASFMVPLFLNTISSNLVQEIRGTASDAGDASKVFVLAGFCLIAAVSSSRFISTVSDRVLKEAQDARREVNQIKKEVEPIIDMQTEKEPQGVASVANSITSDESSRGILNALANSQYTLRTRTGISGETGIKKSDVNDILEKLVEQDLVRKVRVMVDDAPRSRWYLSAKGRAALRGNETQASS